MEGVMHMKTIGIIGAMEEEIIALRRRIELQEIHQIAGMDFYEATMKDAQVIVVRCENGKVNAAVCTQILIDRFKANYIMNIGVAGGLHPDVNIGDVIIASDIDMPADTNCEVENVFWETDKRLIGCAKEVADKVLKEHQVWIGHIESQDEFAASVKIKEEPYSTFTAFYAEMEGAAIAHTCYMNKIPFVMLRTISDRADNGIEMNFDDFVNLAARQVSKMIEGIVEYI